MYTSTRSFVCLYWNANMAVLLHTEELHAIWTTSQQVGID